MNEERKKEIEKLRARQPKDCKDQAIYIQDMAFIVEHPNKPDDKYRLCPESLQPLEVEIYSVEEDGTIMVNPISVGKRFQIAANKLDIFWTCMGELLTLNSDEELQELLDEAEQRFGKVGDEMKKKPARRTAQKDIVEGDF